MLELLKKMLCNCMTKRPEPEYHADTCPVRTPEEEISQMMHEVIAEAYLEGARQEQYYCPHGLFVKYSACPKCAAGEKDVRTMIDEFFADMPDAHILKRNGEKNGATD